jgi:hypothetical protein
MSYINTRFNVKQLSVSCARTPQEQNILFNRLQSNMNSYYTSIRSIAETIDTLLKLSKSGYLFRTFDELCIISNIIYGYSSTHYGRSIISQIKPILETGFCFDPFTSINMCAIDPIICDKIMENYNYTLDKAFLNEIIKGHHTPGDKSKYNNVMEKILKIKKVQIVLSKEEIEEHIKSPNALQCVILHSLNEPLLDIDYDKITMNFAETGSLESLKLIVFRGGVLNINVFEKVCNSIQNRLEKILFLLENKLEPNKKCFDIIIEDINYHRNYDTNITIGGMKYRDTPEDIINLFVSKGYVITYDDIKNCIKKKIIIKDCYIKNCNIKFETDFYVICLNAGYDIPPYDIKIKPDIKYLEEACKLKKPLSTIRVIMDRYKLVPSTLAVEYASIHVNNKNVVKYLVDNGGNVDINCLAKCIGSMRIPQLQSIFDKFVVNNKIEFNVKPIIAEPIIEPLIKETKKTEQKTEIINNPKSKIPDNYDYNDNIIKLIPSEIINVIKTIKKLKELNFVSFRHLMLEYLNDKEKITKDGIILEKPFCYVDKTNIGILDIDNWIYYLIYKN